MPVNNSVEDVSFVAGSLDTKTDSSSFRYHYNKLVDATFNTFPKAYVSICDIIPTSSNDSARESVRLLNDTLRDLCFKRRGVKYIPSSNILTHYDGSLRNDLYTPNGASLNKKGSHSIRKLILSTVYQWRQSQTDYY